MDYDFLKRKMERTKEMIKSCHETVNKTDHGHWQLSYYQGRLSALEEIEDKLFPDLSQFERPV